MVVTAEGKLGYTMPPGTVSKITANGVDAVKVSTDGQGYSAVMTLSGTNARVEGQALHLKSTGGDYLIIESGDSRWSGANDILVKAGAGVEGGKGGTIILRPGQGDGAGANGAFVVASGPTYTFVVRDGVIYFAGVMGPNLRTGAGTPEGVIAAPVGSMFLRTDGGVGTTLYVKQSGGTGNTGWAAK